MHNLLDIILSLDNLKTMTAFLLSVSAGIFIQLHTKLPQFLFKDSLVPKALSYMSSDTYLSCLSIFLKDVIFIFLKKSNGHFALWS